MTADLPNRIAEKISADPVSGCWVWAACRNAGGYGVVRWNGPMHLAHRVLYQLLCGPITEGLQVDHLCRNRACVNPQHMELVTSRENTLRGEGVAAYEARKTHCIRGHVFDDDNTVIRQGSRKCRICVRASTRIATARYRARLACVITDLPTR